MVAIAAAVTAFLAPDKNHSGIKSCLANYWNRWSEVYLHKRLRSSWEIPHFQDRNRHSEFDTETKLLKMTN